MSDFKALQQRLAPIWRSIESEAHSPHTSVVVPSLSFHEEELAKIQGVSFYEERLLFSLIRLRDPGASVIYITSQPIHPEIVEYYLDLLQGVSTRSARSRLHLLSICDAGPQPLSRKILDRPRFLRRIRDLIRDPEWAYLTCFNSTELERDLAVSLGIPLNGVDPELLWAGTKSGSRRIFDEAGVDQAPGFVDIQTVDQLVDALGELKRADPGLRRAVVKLNESFAGAGNAVYTYPASGAEDRAALRLALEEMSWGSPAEDLEGYLDKLERMGGIAEAFVEIDGIRSPSVQLRINPDGTVALISTHEQVLGGATGQTYLGCRFPADASYRSLIQQQALRIGEVLRNYGVISRCAVDFLVFRGGEGGWRCLAVEINLRMGGTTPPFMALQFLTGGQLDRDQGIFTDSRGTPKFYYATDNLRSTSYRGLLPEDFSDILAARGLGFDPFTGTGSVFHMLGALSQFGKIGVTCVGDSPQQADEIYRRVVEVLDQEGGVGVGSDLRTLHPFEVAVRGME